MTKFYYFLFLLCCSAVFVPESAAQKKKAPVVKDTVIVVFCSSLPQDLNGRATYQAMQTNLLKIDKETDPDLCRLEFGKEDLLADKFTPEALTALVERLGRRGPHIRVLFHFFDHGENLGGDLPALLSPNVPAVDGQSGHINVEKLVVEPLRQSKLGFFMVLVDACNQILPETPAAASRGGRQPDVNKPLNYEEMTRKMTQSPKAARESYKDLEVKKPYRNEPLGLLLSFKGWIGISTAYPDQQAFTTVSTGGNGSLYFYKTLLNSDANKNWLKFLDVYRGELESADPRRKQTPIWAGAIDGRPVGEDRLLNPALVPLSNDEDIRNFLGRKKVSASIAQLKEVSRSTTEKFCNLVDEMREGIPRLDEDLRAICIDPKQVVIFDDVSIPMNGGGNSRHVRLETYRSKRVPFRSKYLPDSLRLDRIYGDTLREVVFVSFIADKRLWREMPGPGTQIDTTIRQKIFLEVQPETDPSVWEKVKGWFSFRRKKDREEKSPVLVNRVVNVRGQWSAKPKPKPKDPEPDTVAVEPVAVITPENFFQNNLKFLVDSLYDVIEQAANYKKTNVTREDILGKTRDLFLHPETDSIEVSNKNSKKTGKYTPKAYFERFWDEFERFNYDSVYCSFGNPRALPPFGNPSGYLTEVEPGKWRAEIVFDQILRGFRKKRELYSDITEKKMTVWVIRQTGQGPPYLLRFGSVGVESTRQAPAPPKKTKRS